MTFEIGEDVSLECPIHRYMKPAKVLGKIDVPSRSTGEMVEMVAIALNDCFETTSGEYLRNIIVHERYLWRESDPRI